MSADEALAILARLESEGVLAPCAASEGPKGTWANTVQGNGQAITYQIGKLQILRFLAEARRAKGEAFDLRAFHDFLWKNGNVPIALQQQEYLAE